MTDYYNKYPYYVVNDELRRGYLFCITKLNSGNLTIFQNSWNSNLKNSDWRSSQVIWNDTRVKLIFWETKREYPILSFGVGVWVGGPPSTNFSHGSIDAQDNFKSFDVNVVVMMSESYPGIQPKESFRL